MSGEGVRTPWCLGIAMVLTATALAGCGSSNTQTEADSDHDGLFDSEEIAGWDITVDYLDHRSVYHVTSDPNKADTDGDGLSDFYERALGRDPRNPDTDADGLTDCQEDRHSNRSQCEDPGFAGPWDGGLPTDGGRADSDPGFGRFVNRPGAYADTTGTLQRPVAWGDGISDGAELHGFNITLPGGGIRHVVTDPMLKDTDHDGLEDGEEVLQFHTDPTNSDSDGDRCPDGLDLFPEANVRLASGLRNFTWNRVEPGHVQFVIDIAGNISTWPPQPLAVVAGNNDLRGIQQPVLGLACTFSPVRPWIHVNILAWWTDAPGQSRLLDLTSNLPAPDGTPVVYTDVRMGQFSYSSSGTQAFAGPLVMMGADGSLTIQPSPVDSHGSAFKAINQYP